MELKDQKKLGLGSWLLVMILLGALYRQYYDSIASHSISPIKAQLIVWSGTMIWLVTFALAVVWGYSLIRNYYKKSKSNHAPQSGRNSFVYIVGMLFLGMVFLSPLYLNLEYQPRLGWPVLLGVVFLIEGIVRALVRRHHKQVKATDSGSSEKSMTGTGQISTRIMFSIGSFGQLVKSKNFGLFSIILVTLVFSFYWFSFRPHQAKKDCSNLAINQAIQSERLSALELIALPINVIVDEKVDEYRREKKMYSQSLYNRFYTECLREHGI